ncbi:MAG TPA: hypothetical protein VLL77_14255 [Anaerolineales bacterium]|nr:hypothetical protein [Anaerolineales bacterium]
MARTAPSGIGTVRASEIGTFLFCERAWSYQRRGVAPSDVAAQEAGLAWHRRHGRRILAAGFLRTAGWILILGAIAGLAAYLALRLIG